MSHFTEILYTKYLQSGSVSIDTRTIREGDLFFAISGPNFDANTFAEQALEKGASYAVVSDLDLADGDKRIYAEDPLTALQDLARHHREAFENPVIGITGSNGKTTTRELITAVLSQQYKVHATTGNYNNHIGVPLTILAMSLDAEVAVIEMGANHVGEIGFLSGMAQPTLGLITNIGKAHTETFGGIEGVIRGKSELFDYLLKTHGKVFVNKNDSVLHAMKRRFDDPVFFPPESLWMTSGSPFLQLALNGAAFDTQIIGKYNYSNVGAAVAVGTYLGVPDEKIMRGISGYVPDNSRSQLIKKGEVTVILDAYNANPDSMIAALENLLNYSKPLAILGDMNEVEHSDEEHRKILDFAQTHQIEVATVGEKIGRVADASTHFESKDLLARFLEDKHLAGYHVLLKASRSIKLETLLPHIY